MRHEPNIMFNTFEEMKKVTSSIFQGIVTVIFGVIYSLLLTICNTVVFIFTTCLTIKILCSMPRQCVCVFRMSVTVVGGNFRKKN
jgi:hypothetical protein